MRFNLFYIILIFIFSCKNTDKESSIKTINKDSNSTEIENNSVRSVGTIGEIEGVKDDDCIFDQATQTDKFLKDIKELEGYSWNQKTKTAEIILNDHCSLSIHRGGCDHFDMSATFIYDKVLDIEKDKKQIFDNVIWITSLLDDFDGKNIKRIIEEDKVNITKSSEFDYHANFMDEKLYELYYFNFKNKNVTIFSIGYYYN